MAASLRPATATGHHATASKSKTRAAQAEPHEGVNVCCRTDKPDSANFRRVDSAAGEEETHRRLVDRVYGLREWREDKPRRAQAELEQRVQIIPVRPRAPRLV